MAHQSENDGENDVLKIEIMKQTTKRAAIYDRWLATLGGGEQVAFAYATALRDLGFETVMLTHTSIDRQKAQAKMGIDLEGIAIQILPLMSSRMLSGFSEKYDVFINTSYLDYFPSRSKNGLLSIFFPSRIFLTPYEYIKRSIILPSFKNIFIYPTHFEGFRFDDYRNHRIYKWLGKKSSIIFNKNIDRFSIRLFCHTFAISLIDEISFEVEGRTVYPLYKRISDTTNVVEFYFSLKALAHKRFSIILPDNPYAQNIALISFTIKSFRYSLYNLFKRLFPTWEMRLHGGPGVTKLSDLTSYKRILTISQFSKLWIKKYWGLSSDVLYPPVNTNNFRSSPNKKNWIVHVGRFFVTGHNKKQLDLIKVFKKLVDDELIHNWELHFVGSVAEGGKHHDYFEQCKFSALGYPIYFHLDIPFAELKSILSKSKIYWHATGLDENENTSPILFEHFGITTVEAMASGCVPVVINAGGQKEIVTLGAGYLWNDREELMKYTHELTENPVLLKKLSVAAAKRAKYFDREMFKRKFKKYLT